MEEEQVFLDKNLVKKLRQGTVDVPRLQRTTRLNMEEELLYLDKNLERMLHPDMVVVPHFLGKNQKKNLHQNMEEELH